MKKMTGKTIASGFVVNKISVKDANPVVIVDGNDVLARRIDAAIKRAVKEAWGEALATVEYTRRGNNSPLEARKRRMETKYGVKL